MAAAVVTRPNRLLDIGLAVAVIAVGVGAFVAAGPPKTAAAVARTTTVTRGVVLTSVQASGNVQAGQTYSVGFQTGGQVADIDAKVGDVVKKGQALAHLDSTIDAANLTSAQLGLTAAQAHLAQVEAVETPAQLAQAAASLSTAQQQVVERAVQSGRRANVRVDRLDAVATSGHRLRRRSSIAIRLRRRRLRRSRRTRPR